MNYEPAHIPTSSAAGLPAVADYDADDIGASSDGRASRPQGTGDNPQPRGGSQALQRKLHLMNHLLHSLDLVVAAELCTLYYLDCSFFFFILRGFAQTFALSPKPDELIHLILANRPHVFAIFVPNILCFLLHAFAPLPQGSEAARGYLHGGLIVDFVGQKAPTSKLSLLALDVFVFALQCFMLTVQAEANKLRKTLSPGNNSHDASAAPSASAAPTVEELDAEERGIPRTGTDVDAGADDIELQPLNSRRHTPDEEQDDDSQLLGEGSQRATAPNLADVLWSGNVLLADFHVIHAVRTARHRNDVRSAAAQSIQQLGYAAAIARLRAARETQRGRPLGP